LATVDRAGAAEDIQVIVAVVEFGVIDPADNVPDDVLVDNYVWNRQQDGYYISRRLAGCPGEPF
jgi:hypothetical protein